MEVKHVIHVLCESTERLPFRGGEPWQGEPEDSIPSPGQKMPPPKKLKTKNEGSTEMNCTKFIKNYEDASIFDLISRNDLKKEVAKNINSSMKSDSVDIFITGPFCNEKYVWRLWIFVDAEVSIYQGLYRNFTDKSQKDAHQFGPLEFLLRYQHPQIRIW